MKQLKIKDNTQVKKEVFSEIKGIAERVADKTLKQLEKEGVFVFPSLIGEAEDLTEDQMILQSINDCYRSSNIMGFIVCGNERLVIESRFSIGDKDYFFQYLLDCVMDVPNIVDLETDTDQEHRLFQLLLFLFPRYLKAAMRKGIFKTYIQRQYNDCHVKGTIDIGRHITKNTPFIGNVAYHQREYSYDNELTELVRHTIEFIRKKPYGKKLLLKVKEEVKLVVDITPNYQLSHQRNVISENKQNTVRHAYYQEYRALQHLCILILQHQKHQVGCGARQIYGILFDGAWLWEEYLNTLISHRFYHPMNKRGKGGQRLFAGNIGLIYPDFISQNEKNRVIADAKYKPISNIGNRDYLQLLAYMFRFNVKKGFYLYPEACGRDDQTLWMNRGSTYEGNVEARNDVSITKHGLKIPNQAKCYERFVKEMKVEEQEFRKALGCLESVKI